MLKVQLSASYYHVVQTDRMDGITQLVRRTRPDLILTAMTLPDGDAISLHAALQADAGTAEIPVIAITAQNDRAARIAALAHGIDDVLSHPLDDIMLLARIRNLVRTSSIAADLRPRDPGAVALGFSEPVAGFAPAARVALLTAEPGTGVAWLQQLACHCRHRLAAHGLADVHRLMGDPGTDAFVIELSAHARAAGLRALADLRARGATRHAAVIAVVDPADSVSAADALERGADDVVAVDVCGEELALRLEVKLRQKARTERLRDSLRNGLRAAVRDPMTGLFNRRYALPHLAGVARDAAATGRQFAVMMADLDHFKQINDRYGHPAGDAVLVETAERLAAHLRPLDMIARVGGEEFMIVMPEIGLAEATEAAGRLCRLIDARPFRAPGIDQAIPVTISIGVVMGPSMHRPGERCETSADALIGQADRALYDAKGGGRNKVALIRAAA